MLTANNQFSFPLEPAMCTLHISGQPGGVIFFTRVQTTKTNRGDEFAASESFAPIVRLAQCVFVIFIGFRTLEWG